MADILFVSSYNTGYGHRSITEAIKEQIEKVEPDTVVKEIDGFSLGGPMMALGGKMYNYVAVGTPILWGLIYRLGDVFTPISAWFTKNCIRSRFKRLLQEEKPGVIAVNHPMFVYPVNEILMEMGSKIPVVVVVADLDNVCKLWADPRSLCILCPTVEAKDTMIKFGVPEEKIRVFGFPVRDRFNHYNPGPEEISSVSYDSEGKGITFLIMNGSQGLPQVSKIAELLLDNFDCRVIILAGKNKLLKNSLIESLTPKYNDRVTVCGFTQNVEEYMSMADIMIIRASPNVLMESVNMCKPVVVTGAFTGQEEKNPEFVRNNQLGVVCTDIIKLPEAVRELVDDNGKMLKEIRLRQLSFRQPDAAEKTAAFLLDVLKQNRSEMKQEEVVI